MPKVIAIAEHEVQDGIVHAYRTNFIKIESPKAGMHGLVEMGATPEVVQIINGLVISSPSVAWVLKNGNVVVKAFSIDEYDEAQ